MNKCNYFYSLSDTVKAFFDKTLMEYLNKLKDYDNFFLVLYNKENGLVTKFNPPQRFSEEYNNKLYVKLKPLDEMKVSGFVTFTMKDQSYSYGEEYVDMMKRHLKVWSRIRSWIWKYLGPVDYFRVYELTKKHVLHIHVLFFGWNKVDFERLANYYHHNHGFVDVKAIQYYGDQSLTRKYWINCCSSGECKQKNLTKNRWDDGVWNTSTKPVTNYVKKYQLKSPNKLHRAIMSKLRIRTYSLSQSLQKTIIQIKSTGNYTKVNQGFNISLVRTIGAILRPKLEKIYDRDDLKSDLWKVHKLMVKPKNTNPWNYKPIKKPPRPPGDWKLSYLFGKPIIHYQLCSKSG